MTATIRRPSAPESVTPIFVAEPDDVVLAEVTAGLDLVKPPIYFVLV
jgi:hypothetical protein